jgi:dTDP-4-amino-4,6-dideoxygalactose transaminase
LQPAYKKLGYRRGDFSVSESLAKEIISLPIFPELSVVQLDKIVKVLNSF